jgi:hypothetical protein
MSLDDATAVHSAIPGAAPNGDGTFNMSCSSTTHLQVVLGGGHYRVDPADLVDPTTNSSGVCVSNILGLGGPDWILGSAFLRNVLMPQIHLT